MNSATLNITTQTSPSRTEHAIDIGVWVLIGVTTSLFTLFLWAYVMRMDGKDWFPMTIPWQLWLSTALLCGASVALGATAKLAGTGRWGDVRRLLPVVWAAAIAFLFLQAWAWQSLISARVSLISNPAASFFFLLTAMHGLHVAGGLIAWARTSRRLTGDDQPEARAPSHVLRIRLCARYWHFLLAVWLVLFAAIGWLTPELVRLICGTP